MTGARITALLPRHAGATPAIHRAGFGDVDTRERVGRHRGRLVRRGAAGAP
ncbi:hypothetical protein ACFWUW_11090 [Streptomyces sp. NPDC058655]|uniref:hypothetical protein n=1 Tax=unclassified Streptomyces TaxID=2593676 RepID=UPI003659E4F8